MIPSPDLVNVARYKNRGTENRVIEIINFSALRHSALFTKRLAALWLYDYVYVLSADFSVCDFAHSFSANFLLLVCNLVYCVAYKLEYYLLVEV